VRRFLSPLWVAGHLLVGALVVVFLLLAWWQVGRAAEGNSLSIGYALQWPAFAAFGVYAWVKTMLLLRRESLEASPASERTARGHTPEGHAALAGAPREHRTTLSVASTGGHGKLQRLTEQVASSGGPLQGPRFDEEDDDLAAYNRYLASLHREES
jgi:DNA-binding transcriptional regulator of glucitol operon